MPWQTKTLDQHVTDAQRAFNANLPGADAALARNNLKPMAMVLGGGFDELTRFAAWAADQRFVLTCDADQLDRHGAEMKPPVPRKEPAQARGPVTVTAAGAISLATGSVLARSDGVQFTVDAGIVLAGAGTATVQVTAVLAGADGSSDAAVVLAPVSGLTGTAVFAVSADGLGGGADRESHGAYKARLLFAKAFPEHAGAPADWLRYTLAIPGVTRAFIEPLGHGRGTVVVYPFFDLTRPNGIPLESDRAQVLSALLVAGPGAGQPVVRIAEAVPVDVAYSDLSPSTPEVRQAVAAEVANTFFINSRVAGNAEPHPSMPFLATPASFSRSWLWQAAANASGEQRHVLVTPASDPVLTSGQTAVLGTLSFQG
ncbi:baseplate J/gp47 family protein [Bosea sp. BK604]|uniref:baseplate J/gp47 family protein n=1 Tax=Bosea sp. BK604 TaxID=2512180 RepID=UPI00104BD0C8|nr:baseplate J/gp47 family protein [Bosea sp. BK604]TCR69684.1 putative phage protein gp47/JayE [Bosea sp. BK604]